jgi:hypothetical protein
MSVSEHQYTGMNAFCLKFVYHAFFTCGTVILKATLHFVFSLFTVLFNSFPVKIMEMEEIEADFILFTSCIVF